ncbi:unnamed protein product [Parnassius apollo]|uniref:(apollo) hypothetical protein n=1 Tax=Parnassius apollo TaxID=110799 RepID=A0A8S3W5V6_PARAO|nr:unnamed protein product [Parnassius apollo]
MHGQRFTGAESSRSVRVIPSAIHIPLKNIPQAVCFQEAISTSLLDYAVRCSNKKNDFSLYYKVTRQSKEQ